MSNQLESDFTIIVGEEELKKNEISIRDMKKGEQKNLKIENIKDIIL